MKPLTPVEVAIYYAERVPALLEVKMWQWRGPCLVHIGSHFNFAVESDTGRWHCFSKCGRGGDAYCLEIGLNGSPFASAFQRISKIVGRPVRAVCIHRYSSIFCVCAYHSRLLWRPNYLRQVFAAIAETGSTGDKRLVRTLVSLSRLVNATLVGLL
jgi:hypothetical protein